MLQNGMLRDLTDAEIETYEREGVVRLAAVLDIGFVEQLARGVDDVIYRQIAAKEVQAPLRSPSMTERAEALKATGVNVLTDERAEAIPEESRGQFFARVGANLINDDIRQLALTSPLPYIAARLFRAAKVNFYDDQVLVKEPSTREYTAFHTDEPYYHLRGDQVCGIWISPDIVSEDSGAMQYVRGSHRWGTFYKPNLFVGQVPTDDSLPGSGNDDEQIQLPDIEGHRDEYDIVTYASRPGDVIVHHSNLIHGSGPNYRSDVARRAVSFRYTGEDVRYRFRRSAPVPHHHRHNLQDGDVIDSAQFPVVYRA